MTPLRPGDALGASYRLIENVGSGAVGDVWAVEAIVDGARFAAKILKAEHASDPELVERFVRERSVLLGLRHSHIVEVRDLVVEGANLAIVMEFVPGGSVRELLASHGPLRAADALAVCAQVFQALAAAHADQVTHRDIKPDNVLLAEAWQDGHAAAVRVSDFGIASVVSAQTRRTTGVLGTPHYMAPELISHGQTTPAADVYSTGIMLYELLAGRTPFAGSGTDFTVAYRHVSSVPPRLDLPDPLWDAVCGLLAKDPRERPAAADAAADLARLAANYRELSALEASPPIESFEEIERPATMLRQGLMPEEHVPADGMPLPSADAPELGDGAGQTVLRPMQRRPPTTPQVLSPVEGKPSAASVRPWLTKKTTLLGAAGAVLVAALGIAAAVAFSGGKPPAAKASADKVQATQHDAPLPSGLTVSRTAEFLPSSRQITLQFTFAAQKAPLSGAFFQAIPGTGKGSACPVVRWQGASGIRHQQSTTGLKAECGWSLEGIVVPANGQTTATAKFEGTVADAAALTSWLGTAASTTTATITDAEGTSTAYAAQRLQDIAVRVPPRAVGQTPLAVTLMPVWPTGIDEFNPLFRSPSMGAPSQMLADVAGDPRAVRFSDGCSGAVSVAPDGVTVTALSVTSDCTLRAVVGNFTDLESNPFSITTRE